MKMTESESKQGQLLSVNLAAAQTDEIIDFYAQVIGWDHDAFKTEDMSGYAMKSKSGKPAKAVISHLKGQHADMPPAVWIPYFQVDNLQKSLKTCEELGGKVLKKPESCCSSYAVIENTTGAICALYQK
jgi:predicted enzyme related to lactoylglutathione lyase